MTAVPPELTPTARYDVTALRASALNVAPASARARYYDADLKILPGIHLPLRSMLVDTPQSRTRILISPVGTVAEHAGVGDRLDALVAPSLLHGRYIKAAQDAYHPVGVWGPPGYGAKHPELGEVKTLGVDPWPFGDELDFQVIEGAPKREEVVLFHRASKTIYTADIVFNLGEPTGLLAPFAYRMMGVYKTLAMPKMWPHWVRDKAAFRRSIERVLAWDFEKIAVAHGALVTSDGHDKLERAIAERGLLT